MSIEAIIGGVVLAVFLYFVYVKVQASRDKKKTGGGTPLPKDPRNTPQK